MQETNTLKGVVAEGVGDPGGKPRFRLSEMSHDKNLEKSFKNSGKICKI